MIVKSVEFFGSAVSPSQSPDDGLPEILLCGRSNVGKSSFINAMLAHGRPARVSQTPGKTRLVNFFRINGNFYFVDVPGYGYAKVSKTEMEEFRVRIETYAASRPQLVAAVLLLDIRRDPSEDDLQLVDWLRSLGVEPVYVLSKADKLSNNERAVRLRALQTALSDVPKEFLFPFSAITKENAAEIWEVLEARMTASR